MQIWIVVGVLFSVQVLMLIEKALHKKKVRVAIKEAYGKKPAERKLDFEKIGYHWDDMIRRVPEEERIDDITWNDLEMQEVYKRINGCRSFAGDQVLFSRLHWLPKASGVGEAFERSVGHFSSKDREREQVQLLLSDLGTDRKSYHLPRFLKDIDTYRITGLWSKPVMQGLQLLLAASVVTALVTGAAPAQLAAASVFSVNLVLYAVGKNRFEQHLDMIRCVNSVIGVATTLANKKKFTHEAIFEHLTEDLKPFKRLWKATSFLQVRKDAVFSGDLVALVYDYLVGATLWDFVMYDRILCRLRDHQRAFLSLYEGLGEIDAAIAVASFRESLPYYCPPEFTDRTTLRMTGIYHPLIDNPVANSVELENSCIITGSNASGKSTFIKAVALSAILGQNIHTCMASEMVLPRAKIITSMAVRDDLMAGESYYIKEIRYIKRILDSLDEDRLVICMIDEILRGTNNEERVAASASILEFLEDKHCLAIVASHDSELTEIPDDQYGKFYFAERMEGKDVVFDYTINQGVSQTRNAIRLLHAMGFPEEIINGANKRVSVN